MDIGPVTGSTAKVGVRSILKSSNTTPTLAKQSVNEQGLGVLGRYVVSVVSSLFAQNQMKEDKITIPSSPVVSTRGERLVHHVPTRERRELYRQFQELLTCPKQDAEVNAFTQESLCSRLASVRDTLWDDDVVMATCGINYAKEYHELERRSDTLGGQFDYVVAAKGSIDKMIVSGHLTPECLDVMSYVLSRLATCCCEKTAVMSTEMGSIFRSGIAKKYTSAVSALAKMLSNLTRLHDLLGTRYEHCQLAFWLNKQRQKGALGELLEVLLLLKRVYGVDQLNPTQTRKGELSLKPVTMDCELFLPGYFDVLIDAAAKERQQKGQLNLSDLLLELCCCAAFVPRQSLGELSQSVTAS